MELLSRQEELSLIKDQIESLGDGLKILEAGCGRKWPVQLSISHRLTGVDPDLVALQQRRDLEESHVSTLNEIQFPDHSFDVVYCSFVLEHVVGVAHVLEKFARWVRPGGLIVLRIPDAQSVFGFITRWTPHITHVWYKRYLEKRPNAGKPGYDPYPVVYERSMRLSELSRFAQTRGYTFTVFGNGDFMRQQPIIRVLARLVSIASMGYLAWRHANLLVLIRT